MAGNSHKLAIPYYYTTAKGMTYLLTPGRDGITEELITFLREDDERTRLSDRYYQEAISGAFRLAEELYNSDPDSYGASPIDCIPDWTFSPELVLFGEKPTTAKLDSLRALVPKLILAQQHLFWDLSQGKRLVDIAREEGVEDETIRARVRRLYARLRKLYTETYGRDPRE